EVKRKKIPRPRGNGVLLDAFSPGSPQRWGGHSLSAPACYRWLARRRAPRAQDEPHPTVIRTPAARARRARRLCRGTSPGRARYAYVPAPVAIQKRRAHLLSGRGPFGTAHGGGGSSGEFRLRGGGLAGVGRTWDGASVPTRTQ